jgi:FKBP-type peptidyl-prolyl cis-trans isomerase
MDLKTTASGLQYCDIVVGDGKEPVKGAKIEAHYIGKLTNGQKFDASYDRGKPLPFQVGAGQVIQGWDLGILGSDDFPAMKVGGKRRLLIPPELGYGARGAGGVIPPNAVLDFEVELVKA